MGVVDQSVPLPLEGYVVVGALLVPGEGHHGLVVEGGDGGKEVEPQVPGGHLFGPEDVVGRRIEQGDDDAELPIVGDNLPVVLLVGQVNVPGHIVNGDVGVGFGKVTVGGHDSLLVGELKGSPLRLVGSVQNRHMVGLEPFRRVGDVDRRPPGAGLHHLQEDILVDPSRILVVGQEEVVVEGVGRKNGPFNLPGSDLLGGGPALRRRVEGGIVEARVDFMDVEAPDRVEPTVFGHSHVGVEDHGLQVGAVILPGNRGGADEGGSVVGLVVVGHSGIGVAVDDHEVAQLVDGDGRCLVTTGEIGDLCHRQGGGKAQGSGEEEEQKKKGQGSFSHKNLLNSAHYTVKGGKNQRGGLCLPLVIPG
ncbi:MAG: hypothetical protein BWY86_00393 [Candidatus Aminicenantes bacterium ADurb.Bin508]|nr:MAG: hypothetical protein BWY86_00393 [Candidatus Aminicenantes bacterium ADurb.Bin508]